MESETLSGHYGITEKKASDFAREATGLLFIHSDLSKTLDELFPKFGGEDRAKVGILLQIYASTQIKDAIYNRLFG